MDEAERCHRLAYIAYGNLLTTGTIAEVIAAAGLSTWTVRGEQLSQLAGELRRTPGIEQVVVFGETLHLTGADPAGMEAAVAPFRQRPGLVWEPSESNIEDVFIYLSEKKAKDNFR